MKKVIFIIASIFLAAPVMAKSKHFVLSVTEETRFDDNIFYSSRDESSDILHILVPNAQYSFTGDKAKLLLYCNPSFRYYQRHSELDNIAYNALFDLEYKLLPKITLKLTDTYTEDDVSYYTNALIGAIGRNSYWTNSVKPTLIFTPTAHTTLSLGHTHDTVFYDVPGVLDSSGDLSTFALVEKISSTLSFLFDATMQKRRFDSGDTTKSLLFDAGLTKIFNNRFSSTVKIGHQRVEDVASDTSGSFFYFFEALIQLLKKTTLTSTVRKQDTVVDYSNSVVDIFQGSVALTQQLSRRLTWVHSFSYLHANYDATSEQDAVYRYDTNIQCLLNKDFTLRFGYIRENKNSNLSVEYTKNIAYCSFAYQF